MESECLDNFLLLRLFFFESVDRTILSSLPMLDAKANVCSMSGILPKLIIFLSLIPFEPFLAGINPKIFTFILIPKSCLLLLLGH